MSLARRFNAGTGLLRVVVAWRRLNSFWFQGVATRPEHFVGCSGLKGRAKFISALRVESLIACY